MSSRSSILRLANFEPLLLVFDGSRLGELELAELRTLLARDPEKARDRLKHWSAVRALVALRVPGDDLRVELVEGALERSHLQEMQLEEMEAFELSLDAGRLGLCSGAALRHPIEVLERDMGSSFRTEVPLKPGAWSFLLAVSSVARPGEARLLLAATAAEG